MPKDANENVSQYNPSIHSFFHSTKHENMYKHKYNFMLSMALFALWFVPDLPDIVEYLVINTYLI